MNNSQQLANTDQISCESNESIGVGLNLTPLDLPGDHFNVGGAVQ